MVKQGPLGYAETYVVEHECDNMALEELCKRLDRSKKAVSECIAKYKLANPDLHNVASQIPSRNGSTVMTKGGSEMIGEVSQRSVGRSDCVVQIKKK